MIDIMNPEALRNRFVELGLERDAMLDVSTPLREERDQLIADCDARIASLSDQIAAAEEGMFSIDQERALIARALGGRTGITDDTE